MSVEIIVRSGMCQGGHHKAGDRFVVDWETPGGLCIGAWDAIAPYVMTLLCEGNFSWENEPGYAVIHCPDPNGITLELRRRD